MADIMEIRVAFQVFVCVSVGNGISQACNELSEAPPTPSLPLSVLMRQQMCVGASKVSIRSKRRSFLCEILLVLNI